MPRFNDECVIYVSLEGNDNYNGKAAFYNGIDGPLKSIEAALGAAGTFREQGAGQPFILRLLGGEYALEKTLHIGSNLNDITIEPYDELPVVISGGRYITGMEASTVNGMPCFKAYIPEVKDGAWNFTDLYVNGERADITRYPEAGYLRMESVEYTKDEPTRYDGSQGSSGFTAFEGDLFEFKNINDCVVSICHFWIDEHSPILSYDKDSRFVKMKYKTRYRIDNESGDDRCAEYVIENVFEALKKPGQWYLDRAEGMLYYIPRPGQTLENIKVTAPRLTQLVKVVGSPEDERIVRNIRFKNIAFAHTCGDYTDEVIARSNDGKPGENKRNVIEYASGSQGASNIKGIIYFEGAEGCTIENCIIRNSGWYGIEIGEGCSNIRIAGNDIYDGGAGGVKINGSDYYGPGKLQTFGNIICDNRIRHCGRRYMSACGILLQNSYNNEISHNEIYDLYYTGISSGWVWGYSKSITRNNLIAKNHIYNIGQNKLSDMGGIYLLGAQPGTVVTGNVIHDVRRKLYGGWGLYTDEGSSFILAENNICFDTSSNSYHQHYGSMNVVRNNIFAFSRDPVLNVQREENHLSIIFENNIIYAAGTPVYGCGPTHISERKIGLRKNIVFDCLQELPKFTASFFDKDGKWIKGIESSLEMLQSYGLEEGTIIADPCFRNAAARDFTLCENSPAISNGFRPIDVSDVGPRKFWG